MNSALSLTVSTNIKLYNKPTVGFRLGKGRKGNKTFQQSKPAYKLLRMIESAKLFPFSCPDRKVG